MSTPKWLSVGNRISFLYNVTWKCEGTVVSVNASGIATKIEMKDVSINGKSESSYTFLLPSIKNPSLK
jgi:hypothetical protein